jgi:hypothetical protein
MAIGLCEPLGALPGTLNSDRIIADAALRDSDIMTRMHSVAGYADGEAFQAAMDGLPGRITEALRLG